MKKVFITAILVSGLSLGVFADGGKKGNDNSNSSAASYTALNQFSSDYKDAKNVVWKVDGNCQKAEFVLEGKKVTAFYSLTGEFLGLTQPVDYKTIPADAQKDIAASYKGYTVGEVIKLEPKQERDVTDLYAGSAFKNDAVVYFVDLKSAKEEILVRVTPDADVYFFKQVK
ncbi:hypothetical protein BEL04_02570 [Mucilaginibacter sp. PPCGB 2223]|uniref:hypothetical protein n=1 Tax=Mucilaginibacter sp. PPCGB 2223 TaxID=1886027 RepID=UPI00082700D1|nr:hypothetical protein [Mucilaginibacter sp. PPCGB 2223]OCX53213.1 hypothetical protein BEL04_02570 [Mucilaginibacter sp. PPCGB 2223]